MGTAVSDAGGRRIGLARGIGGAIFSRNDARVCVQKFASRNSFEQSRYFLDSSAAQQLFIEFATATIANFNNKLHNYKEKCYFETISFHGRGDPLTGVRVPTSSVL